MKLPYYETQLLLEALTETSQRYAKDIADITDKTGAIRLDVPTDYAPNISRKQSIIDWLIKQIENGTVEF